MGVKITETTNKATVAGWIEAQAKDSPKSGKAGILEPLGAALDLPRHTPKNGVVNAPTVFEVANKNEFGLGVPERPFIRGYVDAHEKEIRSELTKYCQEAALTSQSIEWALTRVGEFIQEGMKAFITNQGEGTYAPNSPSTIARKDGDSTPLIDTRQMYDAITYKVGNE